MQHIQLYPYYADQFAKDVRELVAAIEVVESRQGQLLIFALGGTARGFFHGMGTSERQFGVDLRDGRGGHVHVAAVEFILRVLQVRFAVHQGAAMFISTDPYPWEP